MYYRFLSPVQTPVIARVTLWVILLSSSYSSAIESNPEDVAQSVESNVIIVGEAYDLVTGKLRYRELHFPNTQDDSGRSQKKVHYQNELGEVFAEKRLFFTSGNLLRPSVYQLNHRTGRSITVENVGKVTTELEQSSWSLEFKSNVNSKLKKTKLQVPSSDDNEAVIDAGFDGWIVNHWQTLRAGNRVKFQFLAPTRARWVQLQARQALCCQKIAKVARPVDLICFVIEPKNTVLRWLVDPIELGYHKADGAKPKLVVFIGLANLTDDNGDGIRVAIHYRYNKPLKLSAR